MDGNSFFDLQRYSFLHLRPMSFAIIRDIPGPDALDEALSELREVDPDGYANLTEHLDIAAPKKDS